jgi:hypothetical protein
VAKTNLKPAAHQHCLIRVELCVELGPRTLRVLSDMVPRLGGNKRSAAAGGLCPLCGEAIRGSHCCSWSGSMSGHDLSTTRP